MAGKTVTRAQLGEAVYQEVGLSRNESDELVEAVLQEISDTLLGHCHGFSRGGAAAAKLGRDEDLALLFGGSVVHPGRIDLQKHQGIGGVEGLHSRHAACLLVFVFQDMGGSEGYEIEGLPT